MKNIRIIWYEGYIPDGIAIHYREPDFCKSIIAEKTIKAENIDSVNETCILPYEVLEKVPYLRNIAYNEKNRISDYGSHNRFIWIKELDKDNE